MLLRLELFLTFCICLITCQNILDLMQSDDSIKQFTGYVKSTPELFSLFNNSGLTIFIPSDLALQSANLPDKEKLGIFKAHMFLSSIAPDFNPFVGTIQNWKQYTSIETASGITYYTILGLDSLNRFYLYSSQSSSYCNGAKIISADRSKDLQVYHVIDRVLINNGVQNFFDYLKSNEALSITSMLWHRLNQVALQSNLIKGINYKPEYLTFEPKFPGTVLVPTNDAWNSLSPGILDALKTDAGIPQLGLVMSRQFIPKNLVFLSGEADTIVKYGFNSVVNADATTGQITKDLQVNIDGCSGKVIKANIAINFGVIHIIDNALYNATSVAQYLSANNKAFMTKLNSMPNFAQYLTGNYTILALDDATVNNITDPNLLQTALLNSFIPGNVRLTLGKGTLTTAGNVTIRLRLQDKDHFIDSLYSQAENTWINTAKVTLLNSMVGPVMLSSLSGYISSSPMPCNQMLRTLNATVYQSLVVSNNIPLELGSPYTLFVPSDASMSNFTESNVTLATSDMMKYILQRMIIANRLVLETKSAGDFKAATMNHAAMNEMLQVTITQRNCTVSIYGVQRSFSFAEGGFYCFSNTPNDQARYNLIYPVPFVLYTPAASITNFCVTFPCGTMGYVANNLLLLVLCFLSVLIKSEILL